MNKKIVAFSGVILSFLAEGKALAGELKTVVFNKQSLAYLRASQPNYLKGLELAEDQVLILQQNKNLQIINISVFDDAALSESSVDETGSTQ